MVTPPPWPPTDTPPLLRHATQSLAEQLASRLAGRIRDRWLAPGTRLPSVRQCAAQQGLSPSTVVSAYEQLLAQGLIMAERGRGYFVRGGGTARANKIARVERMAAPVNAVALIRGMFNHAGSRPQPGMGVLPPEWLENRFLGTALRKVSQPASLDNHSLRYGEPQGDRHLREVLADWLPTLGLNVQSEQIITTVGATHALDIVSRSLLRPGDAVLVEEPGWAIEFARLAALGVRLLPVPRTAQGPDLEVMQRLCEAHAPKLYVSVSVLHNPTGACLSPSSAHRVLQLAEHFGFYIVEDDTYSHIAPANAQRLSVLDGLQRTIYVSGFSKILVPNWRVGFLVAPDPLMERLLDTKLLGTLTTPSVLERAVALCIEQGHLRRHAQGVRRQLDAARARSTGLALAHGCQFVAEPAGLFGWVDTGVDTEALAQRLLDHGILIAPGNLFHAQRATSTLMRINFATTQDRAFWEQFQTALVS